jgi:hypothetical protein
MAKNKVELLPRYKPTINDDLTHLHVLATLLEEEAAGLRQEILRIRSLWTKKKGGRK